MATKYVDSNAAGANDGTSWADAWASIASTYSVAAGTEIWVASDHNELVAANTGHAWTNSTVANPVRILSVSSADDSLTSGAIIGTTATYYQLSFSGPLFMWGVQVTGWYVFLNANTYKQKYESCVFLMNVSNGANGLVIGSAGSFGTGSEVELVNCQMDQSVASTWAPMTVGYWSKLIIRGLTVTPASTTNTSFMSATNANFGEHEITDADLSAFTNLDYGGSGSISKFRRCKVKSGFVLCGSTPLTSGKFIAEACDDGTITVPALGLTKLETYFGTMATTVAVYRTGGADDGLQANAYSWGMVTNANAIEIYAPLESPPLVAWVGPDASISGATAKGLFQNTRCDPLATPAALTTDATSTWNGSGVGTKQKVSVTLSNGDTLTVYVASGGTLNDDDFWIEVSEPDQVGGPITVRCFLAKPSTTVYVDPRLEIA